MTEIIPEFLLTVSTGALIGLAAIGQYLRSRRQSPDVAHKAAVFHDHHQFEQMGRSLERTAIAVERIAKAVETIADERQSDMQKSLHHIMDALGKKT